MELFKDGVETYVGFWTANYDVNIYNVGYFLE